MGYKAKPKTISVSGIKTDDILKMDISKMGLKDLRALTSRLVSASNKRIRNLKKNEWGKSSHAFKEWEEKGAKMFSTKGAKTLQDMQKEFKRIKDFMLQETSSLKKFQQFREKIENTINLKNNLLGTDKEFHFKDSKEYDKFWSVYHKVQESQKWLTNNKSTSPILARVIMDEMESGGGLPDFHKIINRMEELYKARQTNLSQIEEDELQSLFINNQDSITSVDNLL